MTRTRGAWYKKPLLLILAILFICIFLMPLAYGIVTALKSQAQISTANAPLLPSTQATVEIDGREYPVVLVPQADGDAVPMVLFEKRRDYSMLLPPDDLTAEPIEWVGNWRQLEVVWQSDLQWQNFIEAWQTVDFMNLLFNTLKYALISTLGAVFTAAMVGYGFARFNFPGRKLLFMLVIATMILPPQVTLIPTYAFFNSIGWVGTWLPIIIPTLFGSGFNIFLMRQFFKGIPKELDEAARIDGAGPFRVYFQVILPQAVPALIAVALFHFFWCWNDFFGPLVYLAGHPDKYPISVGLTAFNGLYTQQVHLIQASALLSAAIPFIIFVVAQKVFLRGVVVGSVDK